MSGIRIPDEAVAAHELGHAMAGQAMGLEIRTVRVFRTFWSGDMIGVCYPAPQYIPAVEGRPDLPDERVCHALLAEDAAGQTAMDMWYAENLPGEMVPWTGSADRDLHRKQLRNMSDWGIPLRSWNESVADARDALEPIWPMLLDRIPLLLKNKTLRQKDVRISRKPGLRRA